MFASAGWGLFSALSGYLVSKYSIFTAFQLYFALTAFAIIPVCFLKFHAKPYIQQVTQLLTPLPFLSALLHRMFCQLCSDVHGPPISWFILWCESM